ncbi:MAG: protein translocase SEC61 complex subunit gamma [Hyperthermus sp.]|nr:MAG: protein translocase SEC61 complex subunit gamma [Hyperthermus sp.]
MRLRGGLISRLRSILHEWRLVLQRVRKPDSDEYMHAGKIMWLGILIVGAAAYLVHLAAYMLLRG